MKLTFMALVQFVLFGFKKNQPLQPTYMDVGSAIVLPGAILAVRSSLIHSYGYAPYRSTSAAEPMDGRERESADDHTDCLACFPLRSKPFMNYPG
ncbi:hypothetical protein ACFL17_10135 [Pseudomonadota bacterium]